MSRRWIGDCRFSLCGLVVALLCGSTAFAQSDSSNDSSNDGFSAIGRIGHLAFPTFGRSSSITPVEIFPYLIDEQNFFFGDARGFLSNNGNFGGNFGLGYRFLDEGMMSWYGASMWYDADDTSGLLFQQVGVSLEAIIESWEFRSNLYLPVGDQRQSFGRGTYDARFVGNQLLFDSTSRYGNAMKGVDFEVGYGVPLDLFAMDNTVRAFIGGYFFNGIKIDSLAGFKTRGEFVVNNSVTTEVAFTTDQEFGSNVMAGVTFEFPWGESHPTTRWGRAMPSPFRAVERNYNVIVGRTQSDVQDVVAINPATGLPYEVQHISGTGNAGSTGTETDAHATVAEAQTAGGDLLFVHAGTNLSEQIALAAGQQLLGESAGQYIIADGYGRIGLPSTGAGGGAPPTISGVAGPAVTMGAGSVLSGFVIEDITGNGVVANGVNGATIRGVAFSGISGDAISITNGAGNYLIDSILVQESPGRGVAISGGNANYEIIAAFDDIDGDAVFAENTTGGSVSLTDVVIEDSAGRGVVASGLAGTLKSNNVSIRNIIGDAFLINGGTGAVTLDGITSIENPSARGFVVNGSESDITVEDLRVVSKSTGAAVSVADTTGDIAIKSLQLSVEGGTGLILDNADGFKTEKGAIAAKNAPAVNIEDSDAEVALNGISADGGPFGIRIVNSTGGLAVTGVTSQLGGGGTIKNTTNAVILNNAGTVVLQRMNFIDNEFGVNSVSSDYVVLDYSQFTGTTHYAVDSMNDTLFSVSNSLFTENGAVGEGTLRFRADAAGTYQAQLLASTIVDKNGTPISFSNTGAANGSSLGILMQNMDITGNRGGASALDIDWDGPVSLTMDSNLFTLNGANMTAVDVMSSSTTDKLTATLTGNLVNAEEAGSTGFRFFAASTSELKLGGNGVAFQEGNGRGMVFDLKDDANVVLDTNQIVDNAFGATGFLFNEIAAGSSVTMDNNVLQFLSTGMIIDRGIVFTTVGDTVQLISNKNNQITGATNDFTGPTGKFTGQLRINGNKVP